MFETSSGSPALWRGDLVWEAQELRAAGRNSGGPSLCPPRSFCSLFSYSLSFLFLLCLLQQSVSRLPLFVCTQWLNKATVTVTEARSIEAQGLGLRGQRPGLGLGAATESPLHTPISWSPPRGAGAQIG